MLLIFYEQLLNMCQNTVPTPYKTGPYQYIIYLHVLYKSQRLHVCTYVCPDAHGSFKSYSIRSKFGMELQDVTERDLNCQFFINHPTGS
jgi:hypothetical protein